MIFSISLINLIYPITSVMSFSHIFCCIYCRKVVAFRWKVGEFMVYGDRKETCSEATERHKNELIDDYNGWVNERSFAQNKQDENHVNYCEGQIKLFKTLLKDKFNYEIEEPE